MTLKFEYLQYDPEYFMHLGLPLIIGTIINFILYLFIFLSAKEHRESSHELDCLSVFALLGMICGFIPLFLPEGFYYVYLTEEERTMVVNYFIFIGLITTIPLFVASLLLFMYSRINKEAFGLYLLAASILWLIYYGLSLITLNWGIAHMFKYLLHLEPGTTDFQKLIAVLQSFFNILLSISFGLFVIHGARNSDYKFIYSGLTLFIGSYIVGFFITIGIYYFPF